jgi:hypothetical protein
LELQKKKKALLAKKADLDDDTDRFLSPDELMAKLRTKAQVRPILFCSSDS